jgi:hypothetical protein
MMACMCGDYCCWSCGPAQGNWKCPICGEWASEGCEHIADDDSDLLPGDVKPEFKAAAEAAMQREREAEDAMARQLEEEKTYVEP